MRVIRVLGIDPGGTTGVCDLQFSEDGWWVAPFQVNSTGGLHNELLAMLTTRPYPNAVAIEQFVVSRRAGRSSTASAGKQARDIIGAVQELCRQAKVPVVAHSASQVKNWASDDRLKAAGLYAPTRGLGHARDAARHALYAAHWYLRCPDPLTTEERT